MLSLHFAGAMTGIVWWGLERRLAPRTWLLVAAVLAAGGAVGIAFAPAWPVLLAAAFGLGVGFGVVVVEINVLFAEAFGERTTAMLNLLGACFGAGAILGPLAVAASGGYRLPFCVGAGAALAALALANDLPRTARPPVPSGDRPPFGLVSGFVALCALYVGVESGIGGWETTSLRAGGAGRRPRPAGRPATGRPSPPAGCWPSRWPCGCPRPRWPPGPCCWRRPGWAWPTSRRWPRSPTP